MSRASVDELAQKPWFSVTTRREREDAEGINGNSVLEQYSDTHHTQLLEHLLQVFQEPSLLGVELRSTPPVAR